MKKPEALTLPAFSSSGEGSVGAVDLVEYAAVDEVGLLHAAPVAEGLLHREEVDFREAVGELGDTPLVVEFVVGNLFGQGAVLIFAFTDLDDGVEDTVEFFDSDPEETSTQVGRASVLVAKVLEKGS